MASSLQLGYPDVPRSITNPNVDTKNAIDVGYPMSFLDFIKTINISLEPESLQEYYNFYITTWNNDNSNSDYTDRQIIVERYRDFLKEIIIKYTTLEEKKFLSNVDFNDPLDLDIILGFYSKKLKELCSFYNNKRDNVKRSTLRKKLQGSVFGIEQTIRELVLSYVKNLDDSKMLFDLDTISSKLEIEIEELYDTYPLYLNQTPDPLVYDNKDLDYGLNIFLKDDQTLINEVFGDISEELKQLKEVDDLFENKRKLTEKYIATDFYYLSTGNTVTDILSGKLFENVNTIYNFLNKNYPTTASTQRASRSTPREKGFFRPSNVSIILVNGVNKSYSINYEKLEPNSLYFFPDPNIFGDDSGIIKFTIDDSFLKKNTTSGNAVNEPVSEAADTKYYGYFSKIDPNDKKYFDSLFNSGFIKDYKQDIYGNSFALFKSGHEQNIVNLDENGTTTINLLFNGYEYYDQLYGEGFSFDYTVFDDTTFNETIRTGLSSYTAGFTNFTPDLKLIFGKFRPYYPLIAPTDDNLKTTYRFIEGGIFTKNNLTLIADPVSSDLSAFEFSAGPFYYETLIEGGLYSTTQRALVDPLYPSLTATFVNYDRSTVNYVDGGNFGNQFGYTQTNDNSLYISDNINNTELLELSSFSEYDGSVFVKNNNTKEILHILDAIPHLSIAYPADVVTDISNTVKFDVFYDVLALETTNYIIFEKITYKNSDFEISSVTPQYLSHSTGLFDKISNRVVKNNDIYYYILNTGGNSYDNTLYVYPNIYKYNTINGTNELIYPINVSLSSTFSVYQPEIQYVSVTSPVLSYSSRNNIFTISFLLNDQNNYPSIMTYDYTLSPNVEFISKKHTLLTKDMVSNIFTTGIPTTFSTYLSATITQNYEDILIV